MFGKKYTTELERLREENRLLRARLEERGKLRRQWENLLQYAGRAQPDNLAREKGDEDEP